MRRGFQRRSLRTKIIVWSFLPAMAILLMVALVNFYAYQRVTEDLVFERDRELTRLTANELALELVRDPELSLVQAWDVDKPNPMIQRLIVNWLSRALDLRVGDSGSAFVVDDSGRVIYHTERTRVGEDFSAQAAVQQVLKGEIGAIRTRGLEGTDVVASFAPVPGTSWGIVHEESWANLVRPSLVFRRFLIILLVLALVVPAMIVTFWVGRMTRPVADLVRAAQEVARGNFSQRIAVATGDELEELAVQFNRMAAHLQGSYAHLEKRVAERTKEMAALSNIGLTISSTLDPDAVLRTIYQQVTRLMGMPDRFFIASYDPASRMVIYEIYIEGGQPSERFHQRGFERGGLVGWVIENGQPLIVHDFRQEIDDLPARPSATGEGRIGNLRSWVGIPLKIQDRVTGAISVQSFERDAFTDRHVQMLTTIANYAAVAIENARLYQQAQQLAVLEERNRLARELHDSVTQALYGVTLYAEAAARLLACGEVPVATNHLGELQKTAQEALREMRLLVFELRPPVLQQEGLVAALEARLDAVEARGGLETEVSVEGEGRLPLEIEEGLYRIAQEALNNVLKHARAQRIAVTLRWDPSLVVMEVADDGIGFDVVAARVRGGMGLHGMEERAARLGGTLTIASSPGSGSRVRVEVNR